MLIFMLVLCVPVSLGYIDPGTAGVIIGGTIWPFIVAIFTAIAGFIIKFFWKPIKHGVLKLFQKFKRKKQ